MQPTKKQIALAELKFSYQALRKPIPAGNAHESSALLQQLWQQTMPASTFAYQVLFVNRNREVFSLYKLPENKKADVYAMQIAGLALSVNAAGVIIAQLCDIENIKISAPDWIFASLCFDKCEKAGIEIFDYIICSKSSYLSLRESNYNLS